MKPIKEDEAREKICPFMSIGFCADSIGFRNGGLVEITCIASDCMAWVEEFEYLDKGLIKFEYRPTGRGHCERLLK